MKDTIKITVILIVGLFTAIVIYPMLHEMGHAITTMLFSGQVMSIQLFPIPQTVCNIKNLNILQQGIVGLSGMITPFALSFLISNKRFVSWLISFVIKGISFLAFFLSYISLLCFDEGIVWEREDIIRVLGLWENKNAILLLLSLILICLSAISLYYQHPIRILSNYFDIA